MKAEENAEAAYVKAVEDAARQKAEHEESAAKAAEAEAARVKAEEAAKAEGARVKAAKAEAAHVKAVEDAARHKAKAEEAAAKERSHQEAEEAAAKAAEAEAARVKAEEAAKAEGARVKAAKAEAAHVKAVEDAARHKAKAEEAAAKERSHQEAEEAAAKAAEAEAARVKAEEDALPFSQTDRHILDDHDFHCLAESVPQLGNMRRARRNCSPVPYGPLSPKVQRVQQAPRTYMHNVLQAFRAAMDGEMPASLRQVLNGEASDILAMVVRYVAAKTATYCFEGQCRLTKAKLCLTSHNFNNVVKKDWPKDFIVKTPLLQELTSELMTRYEELPSPQGQYKDDMNSFVHGKMMSDDVFDASLMLIAQELQKSTKKRVLVVPCFVWNVCCDGTYSSASFNYMKLSNFRDQLVKSHDHISQFDFVLSGVCLRGHFAAVSVDVSKEKICVADPLNSYFTHTEQLDFGGMMSKFMTLEWDKLVVGDVESPVSLNNSFVEPLTMPNWSFETSAIKFQMRGSLCCGPLCILFNYHFVAEETFDDDTLGMLAAEWTSTALQRVRVHLMNLVLFDGDDTRLPLDRVADVVRAWRQDMHGRSTEKTISMENHVAKQLGLIKLGTGNIRYHARDPIFHLGHKMPVPRGHCEVLMMPFGRQDDKPSWSQDQCSSSLAHVLAVLAKRATGREYESTEVLEVIRGQREFMEAYSHTFNLPLRLRPEGNVTDQVRLFSMAFGVSLCVRGLIIDEEEYMTMVSAAPPPTKWLRERTSSAITHFSAVAHAQPRHLRNLSFGLGFAIVDGVLESGVVSAVIRSLRRWYINTGRSKMLLFEEQGLMTVVPFSEPAVRRRWEAIIKEQEENETAMRHPMVPQ